MSAEIAVPVHLAQQDHDGDGEPARRHHDARARRVARRRRRHRRSARARVRTAAARRSSIARDVSRAILRHDTGMSLPADRLDRRRHRAGRRRHRLQRLAGAAPHAPRRASAPVRRSARCERGGARRRARRAHARRAARFDRTGERPRRRARVSPGTARDSTFEPPLDVIAPPASFEIPDDVPTETSAAAVATNVAPSDASVRVASAQTAGHGRAAPKMAPAPDHEIECLIPLQPAAPVAAGALAAGLHARIGKPLRWFGRARRAIGLAAPRERHARTLRRTSLRACCSPIAMARRRARSSIRSRASSAMSRRRCRRRSRRRTSNTSSRAPNRSIACAPSSTCRSA